MLRPMLAPSLLLLVFFASLAMAGEPAPERRAELSNMLVHDCGSCHGLTMKGGLGPALLPETLRDKPEAYLAATILYGRPGTPMPPWGPFLSPAEADWMVQRLKGGLQ